MLHLHNKRLQIDALHDIATLFTSVYVLKYLYSVYCGFKASLLACDILGGHFTNAGVVYKMSQCMRFPTMRYVRPAKPQISLRIRSV